MDFNDLINKYKCKADISYNTYLKYATSLSSAQSDMDIINATALLYNTDTASILALNNQEFNMLQEHINSILTPPSALKLRFKLNGVEYGLIPDFRKMKTGELIDADIYATNQDYDNLMGVLYRPVIKKYSNMWGLLGKTRYKIKDYDGTINEDFKDLNADLVESTLAFFLPILQI